MRILVMGAGGIGAYCGAVLQERGHDVVLVARGAHLAAMQQRGLQVRLHDQPMLHVNVRAVATPEEAGHDFDLVLLTVKAYDVVTAAEALRPVIGQETAVLPLQNGIDSVETLTSTLGAERILAGTAWFTCHIVEPGVVSRISPGCRIALGEPDGRVTPRVETIAAALRDAGIDADVMTDSRQGLWEKFLGVAPGATMAALCHMSANDVAKLPEGLELARSFISETVAVARASGIAVPDDAVERRVAGLARGGSPSRTSLQVDVERRHRTELDDLAGAVIRLGKRLGVPTPTYEFAYAVLKVQTAAFD